MQMISNGEAEWRTDCHEKRRHRQRCYVEAMHRDGKAWNSAAETHWHGIARRGGDPDAWQRKSKPEFCEAMQRNSPESKSTQSRS